jgi:sporulation protein YlmC with PRC-barrel domain
VVQEEKMRNSFVRLLACSALLAVVAGAPAAAQQSGSESTGSRGAGSEAALPSVPPVVPLSADALYEGWRASDLLGQDVTSHNGQDLGLVRNILFDRRGQIRALVVEGPRSGAASEFVFRLPWHRVDHSKLPDEVAANLTTGIGPELRMFGQAPQPDEFRITEVTGDYARLQVGQAYGYVGDAVFSRSGALKAVLVVRDAEAGGGTFAFGFPGSIGGWDPRAGYYGLPYVTAGQASAAALRVESARFDGDESDAG